MFWKNRGHSNIGSNTQALEPLKYLSNIQALKTLEVGAVGKCARVIVSNIPEYGRFIFLEIHEYSFWKI